MKYWLLIFLLISNIAFSQQMSSNDALSYAAATNDVAAMQRALQGGADINSTTVDGKTPLIHAVCLQRLEAVRFLLEKKADLNHRDSGGETALMYAGAGNPEITDQLIKAGADVNIKDNMGRTALMQTTNPEIKKLIKDAGGKDIKWRPPGAATPAAPFALPPTPLPTAEPAKTAQPPFTSTRKAPPAAATPSLSPAIGLSSAPQASPMKPERSTPKEEVPSSLAWVYFLAAIVLGGIGFVLYRSRK